MEEQERVNLENDLKKLKLDLPGDTDVRVPSLSNNPFMLSSRGESRQLYHYSVKTILKRREIRSKRRCILQKPKLILSGANRKLILRKPRLKLFPKQMSFIVKKIAQKKVGDSETELAEVFGAKLRLPSMKDFQAMKSQNNSVSAEQTKELSQLISKKYSAEAFMSYRLLKNCSDGINKKEADDNHTGSLRSCSEEARKRTVDDSSVTDLADLFHDNMCIMSHMAEMMYT